MSDYDMSIHSNPDASADAARWRAAVLILGSCHACSADFRDACAPSPRSTGCALCAPARFLLREAESASHAAPWYEADGSTVMLPVAEVKRRRKLAAKVIEAARRLAALDTAYREWQKAHPEEMFEPGLHDQANEADTALLAAIRALDTPAPRSDDGPCIHEEGSATP